MFNYDTISLITLNTMYIVAGFIIGFVFAIMHMMVELNQEENDNETFEEKERKKTY